MKTALKVLRIVYEVVGGLAIALCVYLFIAFHNTMRPSNYKCFYSQVMDVPSPDGKFIAERRLETCPYGVWVQVYLKSANDMDIPDSKVISLGKMDATQIRLLWTGQKRLRVTLPKDAPLIHADGFAEGVTIDWSVSH